MRAISRILAIFLVSMSYAQNVDIKWGGVLKSNSDVWLIHPMGGESFVTTESYMKGIPKKTYFINKAYKSLNFNSEYELPSNDGNYFVLHVLPFNNKKYMLAYQNNSSNVKYMAWELDANYKFMGSPIEIFSVEKSSDMGSPSLLVSENGKYMALVHITKDEKAKTEAISYTVLNADFKAYYTGSHVFKFKIGSPNINGMVVDDSGNLAVGCESVSPPRGGFNYKKSILNDYVVVQISDKKNLEYHIKLQSGELMDIGMAQNGKQICVSGIYKSKELGKKMGLFYNIIDLDKGEVLVQDVRTLDAKLNIEDFNPDGKNASRVSKAEKSLNYYSVKAVIPQADGFLTVLEQDYTLIKETTDSKGNRSTSTSFHYENMIVYKMKWDGEMLWSTVVPKDQVAIERKGVLGSSLTSEGSSFGYMYNDNTLVLLFNDNNKNYDKESGNYTNKILRTNFGMETCLAQANINLSTGTVNRKRLYTYKEIKGLVVTNRITRLIDDHSKALVYAVDKQGSSNRKFGLLTLN